MKIASLIHMYTIRWYVAWATMNSFISWSPTAQVKRTFYSKYLIEPISEKLKTHDRWCKAIFWEKNRSCPHLIDNYSYKDCIHDLQKSNAHKTIKLESKKWKLNGKFKTRYSPWMGKSKKPKTKILKLFTSPARLY